MVDFTKHDAHIFTVGDFKARMELLKQQVRPKLVAAGAALAGELSKVAGHELFPHVAKHARRTVNPPPETWCAFARDRRGYKSHVHYALAISKGGVHARVVLKQEAEGERSRASSRMAERAKDLAKRYARDGWLRNYRGWDHEDLPPLVTPDARFFAEQARVVAQKTGTLDVGYGYPIGDGAPEDAEIIAAFERLAPIYKLGV